MIWTTITDEQKLQRAQLLLKMSHDAITSTPEFGSEAMGVLLARGGAEMEPHVRAVVLRDIRTLEAGLVVKLVKYEAAEQIKMS